ncbi:MAG: hypothetical protein GY869_08205 [Planctomycetes bacterium]|nr:hypothetical protein [Planctomycetota bacterium]
MSVRPIGDWLTDVLIFLTIIIFSGAGLFIVTILYAYIRGTLRERAVVRDKELSEQAKYRSDGEMWPPTQRGLCESCERVFEKVYCLSSGERLCPECYEEYDSVETERSD